MFYVPVTIATVFTWLCLAGCSAQNIPPNRPSGHGLHATSERCFRQPPGVGRDHPCAAVAAASRRRPDSVGPASKPIVVGWFFDPSVGGCHPLTGCATPQLPPSPPLPPSGVQIGNSFATLDECTEVCLGTSGYVDDDNNKNNRTSPEIETATEGDVIKDATSSTTSEVDAAKNREQEEIEENQSESDIAGEQIGVQSAEMLSAAGELNVNTMAHHRREDEIAVKQILTAKEADKAKSVEMQRLAVDRMNRNMAHDEPEEKFELQKTEIVTSATTPEDTPRKSETLLAIDRMNQEVADIEQREEAESPPLPEAVWSSDLTESTPSVLDNVDFSTNAAVPFRRLPPAGVVRPPTPELRRSPALSSSPQKDRIKQVVNNRIRAKEPDHERTRTIAVMPPVTNSGGDSAVPVPRPVTVPPGAANAEPVSRASLFRDLVEQIGRRMSPLLRPAIFATSLLRPVTGKILPDQLLRRPVSSAERRKESNFINLHEDDDEEEQTEETKTSEKQPRRTKNFRFHPFSLPMTDQLQRQRHFMPPPAIGDHPMHAQQSALVPPPLSVVLPSTPEHRRLRQFTNVGPAGQRRRPVDVDLHSCCEPPRQPWFHIVPPMRFDNNQREGENRHHQPMYDLGLNHHHHQQQLEQQQLQHEQQGSFLPGAVFRNDFMMTAISYGGRPDDQMPPFVVNKNKMHNVPNREKVFDVHRRRNGVRLQGGPVGRELNPPETFYVPDRRRAAIPRAGHVQRQLSKQRRDDDVLSSSSSDFFDADSSDDDEDGDVVIYRLMDEEPARRYADLQRRRRFGGFFEPEERERIINSHRHRYHQHPRYPLHWNHFSRRRADTADELRTWAERNGGAMRRYPSSTTDDRARNVGRYVSPPNHHRREQSPPSVGKLAMFQILVSKQSGIAPAAAAAAAGGGMLPPMHHPVGGVDDAMMASAPTSQRPSYVDVKQPEHTNKDATESDSNEDEKDDDNDGKTQITIVNGNDHDQTKPSYVCLLPVSTGDCKSYQNKWFYNRYSGRCEMFFYGGCGGNANRFENLQRCIQTCVEPLHREMFPQQQEHAEHQQLADPVENELSTHTAVVDGKDEERKQQREGSDLLRHHGTTSRSTPLQQDSNSDSDDVIVYATSPVYVPMTRDDLDLGDPESSAAGGQTRGGGGSNAGSFAAPVSSSSTAAGQRQIPDVVNGHLASTTTDWVMPPLSSSDSSNAADETTAENDEHESLMNFMKLSKPYIAIVTALGVVGLIIIILLVVISVHICRRPRHAKKAEIVEDVIKTHMYGDLTHVAYNEPSGKPIDEKL